MQILRCLLQYESLVPRAFATRRSYHFASSIIVIHCNWSVYCICQFHEQVKARMVLGNMLRTVLQTVRTKNVALEQAQQQLSKCEKERDMYKEQVQKLKEQNQLLEQRVKKDRRNNEKSHSKESIYERNRSSRNSGYISHSLRTPRSLETLKVIYRWSEIQICPHA